MNKPIHEMTDEELKELRWNKSIIATQQMCYVVDVYSDDGKVIAIPMDEEARRKAGDESRAIAVQKYRESRSPRSV